MPSYGNPWANALGGLRGDIKDIDYYESLDHPEYAFNLLLSNLNAPTMGKNWLGQQLSKLYGEYAGRQGIDPTEKWFDFLANQNLGQRYNAASPYERGERTSTYAPRMRWI